MSAYPSYSSIPLGDNAPYGPVNFSTANTNRDGTGTIPQLLVGRAPGTRVERIRFVSTVTTAAGTLRIFKKGAGLTKNADGTFAAFSAPTFRLVQEVATAAVTPSGTVPAQIIEFFPNTPITLAEGEQLGVCTNNAETWNAECFGGNL
jgi:hypothetical protein